MNIERKGWLVLVGYGLIIIALVLLTGCSTQSQRMQDMEATQVGYELPNTQTRLYYNMCLETVGTDTAAQLACYEAAIRRNKVLGL